MKIKDLFEKWNLKGLTLKLPIAEAEWEPGDPDKDAAWDLYVELLTRISTQPLPDGSGTEAAALSSVYSIFGLTRDILKHRGRSCIQFSRIAIVMLNQGIRSFTAKWHRLSEEGAFDDPEQCEQFRSELKELQTNLRRYTMLLADIADVEDLTDIQP